MLDVLIIAGSLWYLYHGIRYGSNPKTFALVSFAPMLLLISLLAQSDSFFFDWLFLLADYPWVYFTFMAVFFCGVMYLSTAIKQQDCSQQM